MRTKELADMAERMLHRAEQGTTFDSISLYTLCNLSAEPMVDALDLGADAIDWPRCRICYTPNARTGGE